MYTIYHNPRCRKSREALSYLDDSKVEVQRILYLETPFTKSTLEEVFKKIKKQPSEVLRKNEADWKSLPNKNQLTENEILEAMVRFPKIIERPIVTSEKDGVLARPLENLISFLKTH